MSNKSIILTSAIVFMMAVAVYGTPMMIADAGTAPGFAKAGTVSITLNDGKPGTGWTVNGVEPGTDVEKAFSVSNHGSGEAWIRAKVNTKVNVREGSLSDKLGSISNAVEIDYAGGTSKGRWINGEDGYFYYDRPVAQNETTCELFKVVRLNSMLPAAYKGCDVNISVDTQFAECSDGSGRSYGSWEEVTGWSNELSA